MIASLAAAAVAGGVVPIGGSAAEPPSADAVPLTAAMATDLAAEVERAGRQVDPVSPVAASGSGPGGPGGDEASSDVGDVAGSGSPGFPAVRPALVDGGLDEGFDGGLDLDAADGEWPVWATCAFDDDRTSAAGVRSVVVDRDRQRSWFCDGAEVTHVFPITTARSQPDPGVYEVYAKDMHTSSTFGGGYSTMTHFVAFTYGKFQGARVAFHSVPVYRDGSWVQPLESVGTLERFGDSSGCIRALPADAEAIWDWLAVGDVVRVVS